MADTNDDTDLSLSEQDAFSLSEAAILLDQSRHDPGQLAAALERNMEIWVAIRTLISRAGDSLQGDTRNNLIQLSQFVSETTMKHGVEIPESALDTLINIDLQIAEGLLEGGSNRKA